MHGWYFQQYTFPFTMTVMIHISSIRIKYIISPSLITDQNRTLTQNLLIMQNPDAQHLTCTASQYTQLDEKTQHAVQKQVQ